MDEQFSQSTGSESCSTDRSSTETYSHHSVRQLRTITTRLLAAQKTPRDLRPEARQLSDLLAGPRDNVRRQGRDISHDETRTSNGLALSPAGASSCLDDANRTIQFLRGLNAAICDLRHQIRNRAVRVLYVGCGPHASLAVPLMTIFSNTEALFTLLDIHPNSIRSVKSLVKRLDLAASIAEFVTTDATRYSIDSNEPPDIIILEVMQACLELEPQVAITRHLLRQAPHAVLVPQEVRVELRLTDPSQEFLHADQNIDPGLGRSDRISLGTVFTVSKETVQTWDGRFCRRLPAATLSLPESLNAEYQPMLFTEIDTYSSHSLREHDSGLTCPRVLTSGVSVAPGTMIDFSYELGEHPRLTSRSRTRNNTGAPG